MDALVRALPYRLPRTTRGAVIALAKILRIPPAQIPADGRIDDAFLLGTMAGVILYRHLPPHERSQVIVRCRKLIAAGLGIGHSLLNRILDVWGATPDWGVWSMSNKELQEALKSDARLKFWLDEIEKWTSRGGGLAGVWRAARNHGDAVPVALVGLLISGAANVLEFETDYSDAKYGKELSRRQLLLSSKYYK